MQRLLEELFFAGRPVYRGYVDDPRNTDNAWIETTAMHYHCPRELATRLTFLDTGPHASNQSASTVMWLNVDRQTEPRYLQFYANHQEWVETVRKQMVERQKKPGLLQLVVRWGKADVVREVLTDPDLQATEQLQGELVQLAFRDALRRSTGFETFDVSIATLLMDFGAKASEAYFVA